MPLGSEIALSKNTPLLQRIYIRVFGVPINGLRIRARRILPLINPKYKNIMDAGCGPGVFTFEIARRLPESRVTGFDILNDLLENDRLIAEKLGLQNCFFEKQDITAMEVREKYDLVISIDNLEHIENDLLALQKFYNALIPGGELLIHVPGLYRRWMFFKWKENFYVEGHYRPGYTLEQITEKIKSAGFQVTEAFYTYGWIETVTNNISYVITKAEMKNKVIYSLVFPFLNVLSYFGKNSKPKKGAGVLVRAIK
jgi:2-polyprenyl-3-methyl-5-hydroxy-6-metoxy-1,4-benzoquinol methylase